MYIGTNTTKIINPVPKIIKYFFNFEIVSVAKKTVVKIAIGNRMNVALVSFKVVGINIINDSNK